MLPKIATKETQAWKALQDHFNNGMKDASMKDLFSSDPERFKKFSFTEKDILVDFSKNLLTDETLQLLLRLADETKVKDAIEAMFSGEAINETENRAVLHTALRNLSGEPVMTEGKDVMPEVRKVLAQMKDFCLSVHDGSWRGYTGKKIRYVVNIGIGGSDLGPLMVTEALKPYANEDIRSYFVSNVDATHIAETLKKVTPEETVQVLIVRKNRLGL